MAATQATPTLGTKFEIQPNGSGSWTVVGEVKAIPAVGPENMIADATHLASPNLYEEGVVTSKTGGSADFKLHLLPGDASQVALLAAVDLGKPIGIRITWTDPLNKVWSCTCLPAKFKAEGEEKGRLMATFGVEKMGLMTRT